MSQKIVQTDYVLIERVAIVENIFIVKILMLCKKRSRIVLGVIKNDILEWWDFEKEEDRESFEKFINSNLVRRLDETFIDSKDLLSWSEATEETFQSLNWIRLNTNVSCLRQITHYLDSSKGKIVPCLGRSQEHDKIKEKWGNYTRLQLGENTTIEGYIVFDQKEFDNFFSPLKLELYSPLSQTTVVQDFISFLLSSHLLTEKDIMSKKLSVIFDSGKKLEINIED